jgi:phosphoglycolate phosphatase
VALKLSCVLFDLDGTLVDTAPDLLACLHSALTHHHVIQTDITTLMPYISYGAAVMIKHSAAASLPATQQAEILTTMLNLYEQNIAVHSDFFAGIPETLAFCEAQQIKWGIVTNKRKRFTEPLVDALNIRSRLACVISGDSAAKPKPHPEPMLAACQQAQVNPEDCIYIGDAKHDIDAGNAVNMKTLAAVYGYLTPTDTPETWGAEALITSPTHLLTWLKTQL